MKSIIYLLMLFLLSSTSSFAQWVKVQSTGLPSEAMHALKKNGNIFISEISNGSNNKHYISSDKGATWTSSNYTWGNTTVRYLTFHNNSVFGSVDNIIYRSDDNGINWSVKSSGIPGNAQISCIGSNSSAVFAFTYTGCYRSFNNGESWELASSFTGGNNFTANGSTAYIYKWVDGFYESNDNGASWTKKTPGIPLNLIANSLKIIDGTFYYAGSKIYKSSDGSNWTEIGNTAVNFGNNIFAAGGHIFISKTIIGVYHSSDNGATWNEANTGITPLPSSTEIIEDNGYLYTATTTGLFKRPLSDFGVTSVKDINYPGNFILQQNYPNPFNPSTSINFQIPAGGLVTLKIYNSLGEEAAILVNEFKEAGKHSISFSADDLSAGVYFYQLKASGYSSLKKMILIK